MQRLFKGLQWQGVAVLAIFATAAVLIELFGDGSSTALDEIKWLFMGLAGGSFLPQPLKLRQAPPDDPDSNGNRHDSSHLLVLAFAGSATLLTGCGGTAAEQHARLNALTQVADPTYALVVETCDEARNFILAREGSSYAEDRAAMDQVNAVCDSIVLGFESLRGSQLTARAAIDAGAEGAVLQALMAAFTLWGELQGMIPELDQLGRGAGDEETDEPEPEDGVDAGGGVS